MSVRMALAKLCACACGGAVVGASAVHIAESPRTKVTPRIFASKVHPRAYAAPKVHARAKPTTRKVVRTVTSCAPATVTVASAPA